MVEIVDHNVGVEFQPGLERGYQRKPARADQTYVEDLKGAVEVLLQARECILIAIRTSESRERLLITLLGDILLDPGHSSAV